MKLSISILSVLSLTLLLASCEGLPARKAGLPRIEIEVVVSIDSSFATQAKDLEADFTRSVTERVLEVADMDLRFYPVLSTSYTKDSDRPSLRMTIDVGDFNITTSREELKTMDGDVQTVEVIRWISGFKCEGKVTVQKRRNSGPDLLIDRASFTADHRVSRRTEADLKDPVTLIAEKGLELPVEYGELRRLIGRAIDGGLRKVVKAVDRELTQEYAKSP